MSSDTDVYNYKEVSYNYISDGVCQSELTLDKVSSAPPVTSSLRAILTLPKYAAECKAVQPSYKW